MVAFSGSWPALSTLSTCAHGPKSKHVLFLVAASELTGCFGTIAQASRLVSVSKLTLSIIYIQL